MTDIDALKKLAEAATPGPWRESSTGHSIIAKDKQLCELHSSEWDGVSTCWLGKNDQQANAAFIAAANPAAVLELIELVRLAKQRQSGAEKVRDEAEEDHTSLLVEFEKLEAENAALIERVEKAEENRRIIEAENAKLQRFKEWAHGYLDSKGVPFHPPGTHGAEGCRIGDRMDFVYAELAKLRAVAEAAGTLNVTLTTPEIWLRLPGLVACDCETLGKALAALEAAR